MKTYYKSRGEDLFTRKPEKGSSWDTKNKQHVKKLKNVNGRQVQCLIIEEIDQAKVMQQWKPSDFMLENLIESGAIDRMPMTINQISTLQMTDRLENGAAMELDRIGAEEWAEKYLKQEQQPKQEHQPKQEKQEGE